MMGNYVLVVDDDPDVRGLVRDALQLMGLQAQLAANGRDALQQVHEDIPSVIILDLMMPVMDGFSTLAQLQRRHESRSVPVIIMSALSDPNSRVSMFPGVIGVMRKGDFDIAAFRSLLEKAGVLNAA